MPRSCKWCLSFRLFQRIYWTPMFCITFCSILVSSRPVRSYYTLTQSTSRRTNCLLPAYSIYSKVLSVSGGCNLHTEPEEMAKSRDPLNKDTDTPSTDKNMCYPTPQWLLSFRNHYIKVAAKLKLWTMHTFQQPYLPKFSASGAVHLMGICFIPSDTMYSSSSLDIPKSEIFTMFS